MTRVAVATTSELAAAAAGELADAGGNAVDCALAAALLTMNTEPGVCALAGSAYITVWPPDDEPLTVDGNTAIPGLGLPPASAAYAADSVTMDYGGGITTLAGAGSVAVPGSLAALESAWSRFGRARWQALFAPSIRAAREGFPLSAACHYYLGYSGESIYGRSDTGFNALHDADGRLHPVGTAVRMPALADALQAIADDGAQVFYQGELACRMSEHVLDGGGRLTRRDLAEYRAIERASLTIPVRDWRLASNPPPAVGGSVLAAMLLACAERPDDLRRLIRVQRAALAYRQARLDFSDDLESDVTELLADAGSGALLSKFASASTVHTSAVDDDGLACAVTASSGYGSGEMPDGTGLWLNNCLGELELNRRGLQAAPSGARLPSNMAPSIARSSDAVLALGSPGADRITTALLQFLLNYLHRDMSLEAAIAHPRVHVDTSGERPRLMAEPGLDLPELDIEAHTVRRISMYFGGVAAASWSADAGFRVAADPRREGATGLFGA